MHGSELTYSGDPVKRAIYLRIKEADPAAMARALWQEVDEEVCRCKELYQTAYQQAYEANRERVGLREEMKNGRFWEYVQLEQRLSDLADEIAMSRALEEASQVRLTSDLEEAFPDLRLDRG